MNNYLIPANSKRSLLYFGIFKKFDLILFGIGLGLSLILLVTVPAIQNPYIAILAISPGLITGFLVLPIPNYHNVMTFLVSVYKFYFGERQKFIRKGWCFLSDKDK